MFDAIRKELGFKTAEEMKKEKSELSIGNVKGYLEYVKEKPLSDIEEGLVQAIEFLLLELQNAEHKANYWKLNYDLAQCSLMVAISGNCGYQPKESSMISPPPDRGSSVKEK